MSEEEQRNRGNMIIAAAIIGAALILSWGGSRDEPRYQIASAGDGVVRLDTDSGEMIACNAQRCARVQPPDRAKLAWGQVVNRPPVVGQLAADRCPSRSETTRRGKRRRRLATSSTVLLRRQEPSPLPGAAPAALAWTPAFAGELDHRQIESLLPRALYRDVIARIRVPHHAGAGVIP